MEEVLVIGFDLGMLQNLILMAILFGGDEVSCMLVDVLAED